MGFGVYTHIIFFPSVTIDIFFTSVSKITFIVGSVSFTYSKVYSILEYLLVHDF